MTSALPLKLIRFGMVLGLAIFKLGLPCAADQTIAENVIIQTPLQPDLTFDQTGDPFPAQIWRLSANADVFSIRDITHAVTPFSIVTDADDFSLRIGANGRVGIGTSGPAANLHVASDSLSTTFRLQNFLSPVRWDQAVDGTGFSLSDNVAATTPVMIEAAALTDTLRLTNTGSVGIGTATPANILTATNLPGRLLNLKSTSAGTAGLARLFVDGTAGGQIHLIHANAPANQRAMRIQNTNGVTYFNSVRDDLNTNLVTAAIAIRHLNGNIGLRVTNPLHPLHLASGAHVTAGGVFTNASSRELKQDIEPISSEQARDTVCKLQPVGYRYKEELDEQYVGFIAEDVPELVATKDRKSLAPMDITAVLTKVVQDQDKLLAEEREKNARQERELAHERQRNDRHEKLIEALTRRLNELEQGRSPE